VNYKIRKSSDDRTTYDVVELTTDQIVKTCANVHSAQVAKTHFNCGGGFDGWTPTFILQAAKNISQKSRY
jgi:hypothetical protein